MGDESAVKRVAAMSAKSRADRLVKCIGWCKQHLYWLVQAALLLGLLAGGAQRGWHLCACTGRLQTPPTLQCSILIEAFC